MPRKLSFNAKVVIGSTIFAFASSAFLYLLPPSPSPNHYLRGQFKLWQGNAYVTIIKYPLSELKAARLYEDGKLLKQPNSDPQDISAKGNGLYRLYLGINETAPTLMFSSSDNTNPNTNGRKYRLE